MAGNSYKTSNGERVSKSVIDRRVREAKIVLLAKQLLEHGYNFCEECKASSGVRLDCSHTISVDRCQKEGRAELAWDVTSMRVLCRSCHQEHDKLK
jgi:hypothetical protein